MVFDWLGPFAISIAANVTTRFFEGRGKPLWIRFFIQSDSKIAKDKDLEKAYRRITEKAVQRFLEMGSPDDDKWMIEAFEKGFTFINYLQAIHDEVRFSEIEFRSWVEADLLEVSTPVFLKKMKVNVSAVSESLLLYLQTSLRLVLPEISVIRERKLGEKLLFDAEFEHLHQEERPEEGADQVSQKGEDTPRDSVGSVPRDPELIKRVVGEVHDALLNELWKPLIPYIWKELPETPDENPTVDSLALELIRGSFLDKPRYLYAAIDKGLSEIVPQNKRVKKINRLYDLGAELLGWLVLLDVSWPPEKRGQVLDKAGRFEFILPVQTSVGIEVIFSWAFMKSAKWQPGGRRGAESRYGFQGQELVEKGFHEQDPVDFYKRAFCKLLNIEYFDDEDLDETLRTRAFRGERYFLSVDLSLKNPLLNQETRSRLEAEVPNLEILYFRSKNVKDDIREVVFRTKESRMVTVIREYFLAKEDTLEKCR